MRYAGFGLFVVGLTVSAWYAAYVPEGVGAERVANWFSEVGLRFSAGWVTMLVGVVIARAAGRRDTPAEHAAEANAPDDAVAALGYVQRIATAIDDLVARDLGPAEVAAEAEALAGKIDFILSEEVPTFLDARLLIIERYGLETFAELIGHFAVMERATARAWSAITDDAFDEVPPCLLKAQAAIHRTLDIVEQTQKA